MAPRAAIKRGAQDKGANGRAVRRGRGSTAVYEELREDILTLRMAPGTALDEIAIADRFGLSRTPIREALLMLSREDLVTFLPGRSAIVTPHTMSNAHEYMDALMLMSRAIARLAAEVRSDEDLQRIQARHEEYAQAVKDDDVHKVTAADLAFHREVSASSRNGFLGNFYSLALDYGRRMHLLHYYPLFDDEQRRKCVAQHEALVEAIAGRDADTSERIASEHVLSELEVVQRSLQPKIGSKISLTAQKG